MRAYPSRFAGAPGEAQVVCWILLPVVRVCVSVCARADARARVRDSDAQWERAEREPEAEKKQGQCAGRCVRAGAGGPGGGGEAAHTSVLLQRWLVWRGGGRGGKEE